jgi:hypothetical protein
MSLEFRLRVGRWAVAAALLSGVALGRPSGAEEPQNIPVTIKDHSSLAT